MRSSRFDAVRPAVVALILAAAAITPARGQDVRAVVSKEVVVGSSTAALRLDLAGGSSLGITFENGSISIGDDVVGSYVPGDALDTSWRSLLGSAVALEDGPLARALLAWTPPPALVAGVGGVIDRTLDEALTGSGPGGTDEGASAPATARTLESPELGAVLSRLARVADLPEALADVDLGKLRISVDRDLRVGPGSEVEATVVVVDADLELAGSIEGDAIVVGGDVLLLPGGRISGDVRLADGEVLDRGGVVAGRVVRLESRDARIEREIRDRVQSEVRRATTAASGERRRPRGFSRVTGGIGDALGDFLTALVLGLVGSLALYFAGPNMDAVAETARRSPGRAALVGVAGAFLTLPAYILGIVALAISIIGIPALILWAPLFPVAIGLAGGMGYLAVARNVGAWLSRQDYPYTDWVRVTNPYSLMFGGSLALMAPFVAAHLISIVPFLGALHGVLEAVGVMAGLFVVLVGFGAVLLTRGGRRPEFWGEDYFAASEPDVGWPDPDLRTRPTGAAPAEGDEDVSPEEPLDATTDSEDPPSPERSDDSGD